MEVTNARMDELKKLLEHKPTNRKDTEVQMEKRANAIIALVQQSEEQSMEVERLKAQNLAARAYIGVLASHVEALQCFKDGTEPTGHFDLTIQKDDVSEACNNLHITWEETDDSTGIIIHVQPVPEQSAQEIDDTGARSAD